MSVANLVAYMEKEKSKLRRLKRGYRSRKKREEATKINKQFQLDSRRVYENFKKMIETQEDADKPKYDHGQQGSNTQDKMFDKIEEASSFWKAQWGPKGQEIPRPNGWMRWEAQYGERSRSQDRKSLR